MLLELGGVVWAGFGTAHNLTAQYHGAARSWVAQADLYRRS